MVRVVQLIHPSRGRRVAVVEEPQLRLLADAGSVYALAQEAIRSKKRLEKLIAARDVEEVFDYDPIYRGESDWSLLPPFDHPTDPHHCLITGTGLTHRASAENRQSMHAGAGGASGAGGADDAGTPAGGPPLTDSMKMYRLGIEGGRPPRGLIGAAPEWFYKGTGEILRPHDHALDVPNHADDGGDEAEIAGCYVVGDDGTPFRVGLVQGNEFSDHVLEAKNYLYLASSKLRSCSLGPELLLGTDLSEEIHGHVTIERAGKTIWAGPLASGEPWMCHSLANLEHHHFKHADHRRAGDAHVHFFGADLFSFKDRLALEDGDVMQIAFIGFGRPLRNPIRFDRGEQELVKVKVL